MSERDSFTTSNRAAWDITAKRFEREVADDTEFLRSGGVNLFPIEREVLGDLSWCTLAVHLQCSHGLDALSLLNLGAARVVGIDFSEEMLLLARRKSEALGANAQWLQADVLDLPESLSGAADLVYTGKGALPWVRDLDKWASGVAGLLKPGGLLFVLEGHPLNWVWRGGAARHELDPGRGGYFDPSSRINSDFPASAVQRHARVGETLPDARERQWNLGHVVTALARAGLIVERLTELPAHFWPQFPDIPSKELALLPHSYLLSARAASNRGTQVARVSSSSRTAGQRGGEECPS